MREKLVERRKHKRFSVSKGAFVALRPHYVKVGQVIDISTRGLAFTYMADEKRPNRSFELDMFLADQAFYLQEVPFRTISDFHSDGIPFSSIEMRRMGVQFGNLTEAEKAKLVYFMDNYTDAASISQSYIDSKRTDQKPAKSVSHVGQDARDISQRNPFWGH